MLDAWFPPAPDVLERLSKCLPWLTRTSPPTNCEGLVEAISVSREIPEESVLVGAGSSDLIFLALREWLDARSRVLLLDPTYGEYAHICETVIGCRVDRLHLCADDMFAVDMEKLAGEVAKGYELVVLVNPNNPTGRHIPRWKLKRLIESAPVSTRFWIDEAYVDFVGADESLEGFCRKEPQCARLQVNVQGVRPQRTARRIPLR